MPFAARLATVALISAASSFMLPAQAAEPESPRACVITQSKAGAPAAECVSRFQANCLQYEEGSSAGIACFIDAKAKWGEMIKERMDEIKASAPDEIGQIAGIEVKYDLQQNLLQCDRLRELTLVRHDPDKKTRHSNARCEATAVGLAYVKLLLQSNATK
ncbi:hypothetical protein GR183_04940 [Stappia sp. GBMRC 2046]|uniref:DUF1311 domain-containing protein n=1 Tax=Stappia sediminis TaxID=2692190 RepID=A0A7X3LSF3_9HYPH|nr:hypothetical protein [Stappia sediminis]MXN64240.1 hypothetical protein [Stappia sediminis]